MVVKNNAGSSSSSSSSTNNNIYRKSNHNKNQNWYKRRKAGIKVPRGSKPPKWEKEGDCLYEEIVNNHRYFRQPPNQKITHAQAEELLQQLSMIGAPSNETTTTTKNSSTDKRIPPPPKETKDEEDSNTTATTTATTIAAPFFSWGGLSVGPVWKTRLLEAGLDLPTPIQKQAFVPITKGQNVIIASATGSGKSLAYLLPLLASIADKKKVGKVWIATPTTELAFQLQRVVTVLSGDDALIGVLEDGTKNKSDKSDEAERFPLLSSMEQETPLLAATPRVLQQLAKEVQLARMDRQLQSRARAIDRNLQTIVLDEADRLLKTEAVARFWQNRRREGEEPSKSKSKSKSKASAKASRRRMLPTPTEELLGKLRARPSTSTKELQVVCASATVGRTLRRQLMQVLQAPSMDKAAVLVTADVRTKKDAMARKTSLLPDTLQHAYCLLQDSEGGDDPQQTTLTALRQLLQRLEPAPMLIFPGRLGVERVQEELRGQGLQTILSLGDDDDSQNVSINTNTDEPNWETTPVYVVGEKMGRGLDLQGIRYVLLLQVPSSAAGYTHLAGRTGRNGAPGTAIALCHPREAPKLLTIAETLGVSFQDRSHLQGTVVQSNKGEDMTAAVTTSSSSLEPGIVETGTLLLEDGDDDNASNLEWAALSESALKRKTMSEIAEYLSQHGISLSIGADKKAKKADLLAAVSELHQSNPPTN